MLIKKQPPASLLGIAFEDSRVHLAHLKRSGGKTQVAASFSFELSASPIAAGSEALAVELKAQLKEHNVSERRCVVALPLHWALTLQTPIPELPEADVEEFLRTEAERNLAYDPESLSISSSRCRLPNGEQLNTLAAVPLERLEQLQTFLRAAQLKVLSFTLGITSIVRPEDLKEQPAIILSAGSRSLEMEIVSGSAVAALRPFESAVDSESGSNQIYSDVVGRELRITLGQVSPSLREVLKKIQIVGEQKAVDRLALELSPRTDAMGLSIETSNRCSGGLPIAPENHSFNSAVCAASRFLLKQRPVFEFLPPKVSAWKQLATKAGPKKFAYAGGALAAIALLLGIAFFVQNWQLSKLQTRWSAIEPQVKELQDMQQQIKRFRPWFDNSFRTLSILRKLTETFPVDGVVTAKTIEIRDMSQVVCTGTARDNASLFKMLDQLRNSKEIADVKMESIRGSQFTFNFRWVEGGSGER